MSHLILRGQIWPVRVIESGRWFGMCLAANSHVVDIIGRHCFKTILIHDRNGKGFATYPELVNAIVEMDDEGYMVNETRGRLLIAHKRCFPIPQSFVKMVMRDENSATLKQLGEHTHLTGKGKVYATQPIKLEWIVPDFARSPSRF